MAHTIPSAVGLPAVTSTTRDSYHEDGDFADWMHADAVYNVLLSAVSTMEDRLAASLQTYQEHPDVQANLQQLQYDLQAWNLCLTTMTNINKNIGDAMNSIASNFR